MTTSDRTHVAPRRPQQPARSEPNDPLPDPFEEATDRDLGRADWMYDADVLGDGSNIAMHLPCCSRIVGNRRCHNGPLVGAQIASGDCGQHPATVARLEAPDDHQ